MLVVYGINSGYGSTTKQGLIFLLFATFMALGAIYSWAYLPDVQRTVFYDGGDNGSSSSGVGKKRLETRTLEELGEGYVRACQEGQAIGVREKWGLLKQRVRNRRVGTNRERSGMEEMGRGGDGTPPPPTPTPLTPGGVVLEGLGLGMGGRGWPGGGGAGGGGAAAAAGPVEVDGRGIV